METLPFELLHNIVSRLDDCTSLYNLLRASPAISRVFDHDGLQLTRAIFSKDNKCDQIRESISLVAILDSSSFAYPSLDAFITGFIHVTVKDIRPQRPGDPRPTSAPLPHDLPDNTPIPTTRRVLSICAQIAYLTVACLEHYLEKFNTLRLDNMIDPEARYSRDLKKIPPWTLRFKSFKSPPSTIMAHQSGRRRSEFPVHFGGFNYSMICAPLLVSLGSAGPLKTCLDFKA